MTHDPQDYFSEVSNAIELPICVITTVYYVLRRINIDKNYYPNSEKASQDDDLFVVFIVMNLIIILSGVHKVLKFMTISMRFGVLV